MWVAEKFQTNLEIAGSLRNSFRASVKEAMMEVEHCLDEGPVLGYRIQINSECH
ncbi:hypothetical protein TEHAL1_22880 [Tetragenococcus halophilus]|nr:hypothetical protein TH3N_22390 [Tetragenococcus halophilus]GEQ43617.1 hypothetical protein TH6N_22430 [Tetragenococcus halophilus]GEQ45878.1 hypothetical protein TH8N_22480 [Tetragenococcus halophilus]GEQ48134.1 hypothetical protein TH9N_22470 [Tetragenococcus halophilus]GFK25306.1 hypothetical protein YA163_23690 [Tetragenococcus halophilus]